MSAVLAGRVAVITGAGTGLGRALAIALAAAGARVALLGRSAATIGAVAARIGPAALPMVCDITDPDQVRAAYAQLVPALGAPDILINNAAVYAPFKFEHASDAQLCATFATNVTGAAFCIRDALPHMRAAGCGDIVNLSSESVRNPFPYLTAYAASKAALESLTLGLRNELRGQGIRVSTLRIGSMTGNETAQQWPPGMLDDFLAAIHASGHAAYTGAGMAPETVAAVVVNALALPREANLDLIELRAV